MPVRESIDPAIASLPRIEDRLVPETVFLPPWLIRCTVPILIVTDSSSGGYDETTGFHLGQIVNILGADPWSHIQFEVTRAHREAGAGADLSNFRFDAHDLGQYSQIWLFGIFRRGQGTPLSQDELRALAQFMDAGGGVFATGDHEDLGYSMCGEVPRVRSMRRWWWSGDGSRGPNGELSAPDQTGRGRHDTQVMGGDQTDPFPQTIMPTLYSRTLLSSGISSLVERYPHPVLCGPNGVIRHLPDHMHEGVCEVPLNLGRSWTFSGQNFVEYPEVDGHQQRPEVIALADNIQSEAHFGVLGAYDGHRVNVGRVVVDATWHHWFNINTLPYINASNPAHPTFTPSTVSQWAEIKVYYRNVAVWLARPSLQTCIRNGSWIRALGNFDVVMSVRDLQSVGRQAQYFWQVGTFARDALGRGASQCQALQWRLNLLIPRQWPIQIDPWLPAELNRFEPRPGLDFETLDSVMIGAAVHLARERFGDVKEPQELLRDDGGQVEEVLQEGLKLGLETYGNQFREDCETATRMLGEIG